MDVPPREADGPAYLLEDPTVLMDGAHIVSPNGSGRPLIFGVSTPDAVPLTVIDFDLQVY